VSETVILIGNVHIIKTNAISLNEIFLCGFIF